VPEEQFVDDDPEYEQDASEDDDAEVAGLEPADPEKIPPDEGDLGHAGSPEGAP
jgi:hypothetical protein